MAETPVQAPDFDHGQIEQAFEAMIAAGTRTLGRVTGYFDVEWSLIQLAIAVVIFALAYLASLKIEPALEERARSLKGNAGFLRMVIAFLRRTEWILFIGGLFLAVNILRLTTWPSRSYLLSIALSLSVAWLGISVLSRILRSRLMARSAAVIGWTWVAASILGVQAELSALLDSIALTIGTWRISALFVIKGILTLLVALWVAVGVGNFADDRLRRNSDLTPSVRVLLGKLLKIALIILAGAVSLSALGIDLTALTVFSGAIGVGLGFGLQKVVSNFISGIIILMDRSIKPGDTITLGETFGWIRELRARFVSVVTRDGKEYLIPNEEFITSQVVNWSFSDDLVRLDVHFGVSYDADPHRVTELAVEACKAAGGRVQKSPLPVCWLVGFGDSSLDFVLRFWIRDPQAGLTNIRGSVMMALWDTFKDNGIGIPFPHREIIMRTPVEVDMPSPEKAAKPAPGAGDAAGKRRSTAKGKDG